LLSGQSQLYEGDLMFGSQEDDMFGSQEDNLFGSQEDDVYGSQEDNMFESQEDDFSAGLDSQHSGIESSRSNTLLKMEWGEIRLMLYFS
jgi:hypothetical protein